MKVSLSRILPIALLTALLAVTFTSVGVHATATQPTTLKVSLDSTHLLMGQVTPIHIELTTSAASQGHLDAPADTLTEGVEVWMSTTPDTTDLGDGRLRITRDLYIQSFDSGTYKLPAIKYIVGKETIASNKLTLNVLPANVDSLTTIHDYADVMSVQPHFWDWVPDWLADFWWLFLIIILLCIGLVIAYRKWWRNREKAPAKPRQQVKPLPPYELAMKELRELHDEELWEKGEEKLFYTRLTDILRTYIEERFHINAMEMTSEQILHALKSNEDTRLPEVYMRQVLEIADYVKFAKHRPFSEDNVKAYDDAVKFVEDTKPKPVAPTEKAEAEKNENKQ